ncbi:Endothelin-converting enzyme [Erysiphe necator]|nr:Endothelin-converting enzyme [Erysiphe necator]
MSTDKKEVLPLLQTNTSLELEPTSAKIRSCKWTSHKLTYALIGFLIFLILATAKFFEGRILKKSTICTTPACIHASSEILHNLSPNYKNIDPCIDFEELVCGGWKEQYDLRSDQGDAFTGTVMADKTELVIKHILQASYPEISKHFGLPTLKSSLLRKVNGSEIPRSIDEENFNKMKSAYDTCMDETLVKRKGIEPLNTAIGQIVNLFPVSETSIYEKELLTTEDEDQLSELIVYFEKLGIAGLVSLTASADERNPDLVVVKASPPSQIGLPAKAYYENNAILQKYNATLAQIFKNLKLTHWKNDRRNLSQRLYKDSINPEISIPDYLAEEVVNFEKRLSLASPNASDNNDVTKYYNSLSLDVAHMLTPQIRLSNILKNLTPPDFSVKNLIVASPNYMKNLRTILQESPKGVIQAYFIWKFIQIFNKAIEAEETKPYNSFFNELQGKDPESIPDRWRICIGHVNYGFGWILSRFYLEKNFSEKAKITGERIVSDIKMSFIQILKNTKWMDQEIVDLAITKVRQIVQKIGYPSKYPNVLDPVDLNKFYSTLKINSTDFFENSISVQRFQVARMWNRLGKPVNRDEWSMTVPTINAYYNPPGNEIVFPAGIMQFPIFDAELPQYINYGAFGSISGHELSHAFDSTGRHYDQNGKYTDWWSSKTVSNFEKRAQCFVNQYSNFTVPGLDGKPLHVDGKLTLGENIADIGGLTASFSAWKKRQATSPDQDLPGLDYFSQDQLFFVGFGNWWCSKSRTETAVARIYSDPHSPMRSRILGTMLNSREFKESFRCQGREPICKLW